MVKKTDIVRQALEAGDYRKALHIAKDFRINVTQDQRDKMRVAYECMVHPDFYSQIGYNIPETITSGRNVVEALFRPEAEE